MNDQQHEARKDQIRKSAELLIRVGVRLYGVDLTSWSMFPVRTPAEVVEYVMDRARHESRQSWVHDRRHQHRDAEKKAAAK